MPVINISAIEPGYHKAIIESFEVRESSNHNPMIVVEVTLDTGELVNGYLVITTHAAELCSFLRSANCPDVAAQITDKMPDFELDDLIGEPVDCWIGTSGQIVAWESSHANRRGY